ncbi:MAG: hypothetical protein UW76_C0004G0018 [Parcubacteria group bacterium GW2011_GWF2_44_8b]|nr:MAG: hypothetical protein UW76_C0004G0018 [Parcubacteria group bacterium GW2011_GWF2_44_8b]
MDGSTVLASMVLDATTVVKEGTAYYITITGFSVVVPKDTSKVLTIAVDPKTSWDSAYDDDSWTVSVPVDGVRAVDGASINQYSPSTLFANNFTSAADVVDSASMTVSLASNSPSTSQVIANQGSSDNEYDELTLAVFNFAAGKDNVKITDLIVDLVRGNSNNVATATTAYIYDGSTLVGSATVAGTSVTASSATFSSIDWKSTLTPRLSWPILTRLTLVLQLPMALESLQKTLLVRLSQRLVLPKARPFGSERLVRK